MSEPLPPLSPTVASIFSEFVKRLESDNVLPVEAAEALRHTLEQQKLDPESLREAVFTLTEPAQ